MSEHSDLPREGSEQTRRMVLAGVAASTVVAGVDIPAQAEMPAATKPEDMLAFIYLSSALTGIATDRLAPGFAAPPQPSAPLNVNQGSDPVDIKRDYFALLMQPDTKATFAKLLQIAKDNAGLPAPDRNAAIIQKVQAGDDTLYLGRSIVLMWYLGAWYDPRALQAINRNPDSDLTFSVISPKAYTQGWALSVAQAHPMGFSQFQFGYWSRLPKDRDDFIGKLT
jgi:hypothetical protein